MEKKERQPLSSFDVLGHRGAKGHAPENTLPSFQRAIELRATMTELDIHLSKDSQLIVMHDPDVARTTNGNGLISSFTLPEIKALDAGSWFGSEYTGERVPTLQDVIDLVKGQIKLNVEIKGEGERLYPGIIDLLLEAIYSNDIVESVVVSSFHRPYLLELRKKAPEVKVGLLYSKKFANPWLEAEGEGWDLHPKGTLVDEQYIDEAHSRGIPVRAWNPNDVEEMRPLLALGVDAIGTDYPERLIGLLS